MKVHKHRLLPGYAGGTYEPDNVLLCTIEEHASIHKTMWLFHGNREDYLAWKFLSGLMTKGELAPEIELLRRQRMTAALRTPEVRAKMSLAGKGRLVTAETRAKLSAAKIGKSRSVEACKWLSAVLKGRKLSAKHHARISAAMKTPVVRGKISAAMKGKPWSLARRLAMKKVA